MTTENLTTPAEPRLPGYAAGYLAALSATELVDLLKRDGHRAPRNVIDECAGRGEHMEREIEAFLTDDSAWNAQPDDPQAALDVWWLRLHVIMILGLMPSSTAGVLLVKALERTADDDSLADWCSGYWPALFRNKPDDVLPALDAVGRQREADVYMRMDVIETVLSLAQRRGPQALDQALLDVALICQDETEDYDLRMLLGSRLLSFPRAQYRSMLDELARQQQGFDAIFDADDVACAYAKPGDEPDWLRFSDPWQFYEPEQIAARQQRRQEEDAPRAAWESDMHALPEYLDDTFLVPDTYVREIPKIGRNEPCPCGSGKKYKKCCLASDG